VTVVAVPTVEFAAAFTNDCARALCGNTPTHIIDNITPKMTPGLLTDQRTHFCGTCVIKTVSLARNSVCTFASCAV
jgi:hypothetical protein